MAAMDLGASEWERSKLSAQDTNLLKKLGLNKKPNALRFPSEESYPTPPMGYRVSFIDHLIRGLSAPIHPFLRGLLFVYGLQLHHLTPNSILHISIFITLCEAFLGVQPNWALWKRIFFCRRNGSPNVAYNIGGVVISVRPTVDYFDVKLPDSVQGWRKKWLYIQEENDGCAEDNIPPFDGAERILRRRSWDAEASEEERTATEALWLPMVKELLRIGAQFVGYHECANKAEEKLAEANKLVDTLAQKLEQSEMARKKVELDASQAKAEAEEAIAKAAGVEDLQKRLADAETALNDHKASQASREKAITKRLIAQNRRFVAKTNQEFELEDPDDDPLLDALSFLEFHGTEVREGMDHADAGLSKLFPYFFPRKEEPKTFLALAKEFDSSEDLGLKMRQENMKVAVESTIALVADSQQTVDWTKVGATEQIEQTKWRSLIKAAKPNAKKILAYLGIKPASTPSSSRPELVFDNYTPSPAPPDVLPSPSCSRKNLADTEPVEDSLSQELDELRQQLQYAKRQTLVMMEQSRKASEAEKIALQQAQEAMAAKEIAHSEAEKATTRENFMLELMNEASADMSAQLVAGARFALIMLQICHPKLDLTQVVAKVHERVRRRRVGVDRINTK
ncbi:hypothetical protein QYE76_027958, partial [Lolium multiflorum]